MTGESAIPHIRRHLVDALRKARQATTQKKREASYEVAYAYANCLKLLDNHHDVNVKAIPGIYDYPHIVGPEVDDAREWLQTDGDLLGPV